MATTTAVILVGHSHRNNSGINPSHIIQFTENDRSALILQSLQENSDPIVIIPTFDNTVDDIYLMIAVFILKEIYPSQNIQDVEKKSLNEILDKNERAFLYARTKLLFEDINMKVVFNILDGSHLLGQTSLIKAYPNDFEVLLPALKKEFDVWSNKIITKGF
ncbi:MAG: hypothetical protein FJX80_02610 [Bacteroidetes bacterium]|nr:hypothetical protein [Bacteroidota bacterium]